MNRLLLLFLVLLGCSSSSASASPPALQDDGLELSADRWVEGVDIVFDGAVEALPEPHWLMDGLFGASYAGGLVQPQQILRARIRVHHVAVGAIERSHVELWQNADDAGLIGLEVGDEVLILGSLWDLRSVFGPYDGDMGAPSYAAEGVHALGWRALRIENGLVETWGRGVPVCTSGESERVLVACEGDAGAPLLDVRAALSEAVPSSDVVVPGVL